MAFQRKKPAAIGVKAPYPGFIEPELATSVDRVPSGARWIHEIKFDGYRVQVHLRDAAVKVFTRRGNDWTNRFRKIALDAWHVNAGSAIIDGEVVAPAVDGTTDFSVLQNELKGRHFGREMCGNLPSTGPSAAECLFLGVPIQPEDVGLLCVHFQPMNEHREDRPTP
jgi:ATP-dependent DNA ligase